MTKSGILMAHEVKRNYLFDEGETVIYILPYLHWTRTPMYIGYWTLNKYI